MVTRSNKGNWKGSEQNVSVQDIVILSADVGKPSV